MLWTVPGYISGNITTFSMDATTDFVAFRYRTFSTAPIVSIEWFCATKTGTPGALGVVITADNTGKPNISAGVPVDIGGGSPTLISVAAGSVTTASRITTTFTNAYTPTAGQVVWIVLYPISGTWDGSNLYAVRKAVSRFGIDIGDEFASQSTDTGSTWTTQTTGTTAFSLLTTAGAYLPTAVSACIAAADTIDDWDDADNPDERGTAWTIPADTEETLEAVSLHQRPSSTSASVEIKAYLGDTQQGSTLTLNAATLPLIGGSTGTAGTFHFGAGGISIAAGTGRVTVHPTDAAATWRQFRIDFGSQARRESCLLYRDYWYCHRNAGGAWTDDLNQVVSIIPRLGGAGTGGGGGGAVYHGAMAGGLL